LRQIDLGARLAFLTDEMRTVLNARLRVMNERMMPHSLAIMLGVERAEALLLVTVLSTEGICQNRLLIYHSCEPGTPLASIPFGIGFPNLPWTCPNCDDVVQDLTDLRFDLEAEVINPVELAHYDNR
jgi:hypothetical protein